MKGNTRCDPQTLTQRWNIGTHLVSLSEISPLLYVNELHIPRYDHLMSSFYHGKATALHCITLCLSFRSPYSLRSQPDDRLHAYSRSNHKRRKSIETQDDLKCELIMNNTLYAGAGGNHVWGIENWIYFSLKDRKHKAEVVNPLPHWRRVARV